jgi:hypothetical protein
MVVSVNLEIVKRMEAWAVAVGHAARSMAATPKKSTTKLMEGNSTNLVVEDSETGGGGGQRLKRGRGGEGDGKYLRALDDERTGLGGRDVIGGGGWGRVRGG